MHWPATRRSPRSRRGCGSRAIRRSTAARVRIERRDGEALEAVHDLADPVAPDVLEAKLHGKAESLLGPALAERVRAGIAALDTASAADIAALLAERRDIQEGT